MGQCCYELIKGSKKKILHCIPYPIKPKDKWLHIFSIFSCTDIMGNSEKYILSVFAVYSSSACNTYKALLKIETFAILHYPDHMTLECGC